MLRIALPRRGRALPLLQVAYDRDNLPAPKSQNRLEEEALLAVIAALPLAVHPVILGDRGFARANFLAFLKAHHLDYVLRIDKGTCMTEADGRRWKLGEEGARPGQTQWSPDPRITSRPAAMATPGCSEHRGQGPRGRAAIVSESYEPHGRRNRAAPDILLELEFKPLTSSAGGVQ